MFESIFSETLWKENALSKCHNIIHLLGMLRKLLNGIKGVPPRYRTLHAPMHCYNGDTDCVRKGGGAMITVSLHKVKDV